MLLLVFITVLQSRYDEHYCIPKATETQKDHIFLVKELEDSRARI